MNRAQPALKETFPSRGTIVTMENVSYYVGMTDDFVTFLGVTPRPATPDEAFGYEGIANVYEVEIDEDQKLKALHHQLVEGGDKEINVQMFNKGRLVSV